MRINKFLALSSGLSRRKADAAIAAGQVTVNGHLPRPGQDITTTDVVALQGQILHAPLSTTTIMLNKPPGFVVSRSGQGSRTIYDLLPLKYHQLKPIGRLDKDSSGLLLLTNDGDLAHSLTHPSLRKIKVYEITLDKPLVPADWSKVTEQAVELEDGPSKFDELRWLGKNDGVAWTVVMHEGRNRQIRRTFAALGYRVNTLHRTQFGEYRLDDLKPGTFTIL